MSRHDAASARNDSFRPVLGAAVALFMALLALAALKSWRDLEAARQREHILETRIEETRDRSDRLRARIERLRSDPGALERLAREDLGMVRPGDVIIELPMEPEGKGGVPIPSADSAAPPPPEPAPVEPAASPPAPG